MELKQLRANTSKSKYVLMAPPKSRTALLKEAEDNPIKMGETIQFKIREIFGGPNP